MLHNTGLEVVTDDLTGDSAEVIEHVHLCEDEGIHLHVTAGLQVRVHGVWKRRNEEIDLDLFLFVQDGVMHGIACPVHLDRLPGLMIKVVGQFVQTGKFIVIIVKLGFSDRQQPL